MIKNINLEFYQFILLIIMIFFTVYVWIKSIIKCSNNKIYNYEKIYNENKKLKKYILYIQKYLNTNYKNKNYNTAYLNTGHYNTGHYNTGHINTNINTGKYNTGHINTDQYNYNNTNTNTNEKFFY
jgi:hypothetical protein